MAARVMPHAFLRSIGGINLLPFLRHIYNRPAFAVRLTSAPDTMYGLLVIEAVILSMQYWHDINLFKVIRSGQYCIIFHQDY
jgi:hypothetical protein